MNLLDSRYGRLFWNGTTISSGILRRRRRRRRRRIATIGGIGRYVIRVAGSSPASLGTYEFSISGVAGNPNSLPPTVMGTASTPIPIPANSISCGQSPVA